MLKMIFMKTKYIWMFLVLMGLMACETDDEGNVIIPEVELTAGSADFSNYVSVGNSLTAGFMDGALYQAGQSNSIPNLLAQKFGLVGGGTFTQPLMNDNVGGLLFGGVPDARFGPRLFINPATTEIGQVNAVPSTEVFAPPGGPYNNLGIPGAKGFHLLFDGYGNPANLAPQIATANPYFVRMASAPNTTVLADALAQNPTFFSLWIGNNDVLGYATSGGDGSNPITPSDGPPGVGFDQTYAAIIATLTSTGAQGVVANIPDVTSLPYFTAVPYDALDPTTNEALDAQISDLNTIYGALNDVYAFLGVTGRDVVFDDDKANPVVILDESLQDLSAQITSVLNASPDFPAFLAQFDLPPAAAPLVAGLFGQRYGQARQATEDDLLVLPSSSVIGTVNMDEAASLQLVGLSEEVAAQLSAEGVTLPLEDKWVLLPSEQLEVKTATDNFNGVIQSTVQAAGLAFVDANAFLNDLAGPGLTFGNFTLTADLVLGGAMSLDGVHPNSRGNSVGANAFMRAIDETYGSNFEESGNFYDPGDFPTNFPESLQ